MTQIADSNLLACHELHRSSSSTLGRADPVEQVEMQTLKVAWFWPHPSGGLTSSAPSTGVSAKMAKTSAGC